MIDYLFAFTDEATAKADQTIGSYWHSSDGWSPDICISGLQITVISTGAPYDTLWRLMVSLVARNATLDNHSARELVVDRDLANQGAGMSQFILLSNLPLTSLSSLQLQPTFAGSNYPFGASP